MHTCTNTFCKYRKKLLASPRVHLVLYIELLLRCRLTFCTCPSSVEITLERTSNRSTELIDLKIGLGLENWVIHVWNKRFLEIRIASCKLMQFMIICKKICVHGFHWSTSLILLKIDIHVHCTMMHVWNSWFFSKLVLVVANYATYDFLQISWCACMDLTVLY